MRETWVRSLGREDPLEKEMATHSSIPAWRIRWTEEPGELQSTGSQRVGHDWATSLSLNKPYWPKNHINNSKVNRVILRFLKNFVLLMHFFPSLIRFNRAICINTKIYKVNINIVIILSDMDNLENLFTYTYFSSSNKTVNLYIINLYNKLYFSRYFILFQQIFLCWILLW